MRSREPGRNLIHRVAYPCDLGGDYSSNTQLKELRWQGGEKRVATAFNTLCHDSLPLYLRFIHTTPTIPGNRDIGYGDNPIVPNLPR